jgi:hypothetical protein
MSVQPLNSPGAGPDQHDPIEFDRRIEKRAIELRQIATTDRGQLFNNV